MPDAVRQLPSGALGVGRESLRKEGPDFSAKVGVFQPNRECHVHDGACYWVVWSVEEVKRATWKHDTNDKPLYGRYGPPPQSPSAKQAPLPGAPSGRRDRQAGRLRVRRGCARSHRPAQARLRHGKAIPLISHHRSITRVASSTCGRMKSKSVSVSRHDGSSLRRSTGLNFPVAVSGGVSFSWFA